MRLAVWSPIALIADALGVLFGRETDVEVVSVVGSADPGPLLGTLTNSDALVVYGAPLDDCRQLFARLDLGTQSSLVAIYLAPLSDELFATRARLFGFSDIVDSTSSTDAVIGALHETVRRGPTVSTATAWTFETNSPMASAIFSHCRDDRDVEILQFIVDGHTDSRIAEMMNLNAQTVRNRVSNMLLESGMSNRTQLAIDFYRTTLSLRGVDVSSLH